MVVFTALAGMYVFPTLSGMDFSKSESYPIQQKINLGLDLQGGLYMVLGVDFDKAFDETVIRTSENLESRAKEKGIRLSNLKQVREGVEKDDPRFSFQFDKKDTDALYALIKEEFTDLRLTREEEGFYELGLAHSYRTEVRERTVTQSIEVIRNRIDEFGVAEPVIAAQGTDRVSVELPGVKDIERAKNLIGQTALLEFKMVDDKAAEGVYGALAEIEGEGFKFDASKQSWSSYVEELNRRLKSKGALPQDHVVAFERVLSVTGEVLSREPYLLEAKASMTGEMLREARVAYDPETRAPQVAFTLTPKGAQVFGELTGAHVRERMAIVLDGNVISAPVIQNRIAGGSGVIILGQGNGQQQLKEAHDLAIVLRAGALPAKLEFMEQRVVGPSLGADSVRKGAIASLVGITLVFLSMILIYKLSGAIATFSLVLNVLFVLAILAGLEATLTLPGIAGIALTVGMAVDSNVIIYERIKEELAAGKGAHGAVTSGFEKAFRSILDANITTAAAALVLMSFGTGPVRGFAVTLLVGIVTTLFTAVFVCRVLFDAYLYRLEGRRGAKLSI